MVVITPVVQGGGFAPSAGSFGVEIVSQRGEERSAPAPIERTDETLVVPITADKERRAGRSSTHAGIEKTRANRPGHFL